MWKTKPQKWQNLIIINVPLQIKSCNSRRTHGTPLAFHFYGQIIANNLQFTRPHKIRFLSNKTLWLLHLSFFLNQLHVDSMESWLFECYKIFVKCRNTFLDLVLGRRWWSLQTYKNATLTKSFEKLKDFFVFNCLKKYFLSPVVSRWEVAACPNILEHEKIPVFVFSPGPLN